MALLPSEYDEIVVSREDKELAKGIVSDIVNKLIDHSKRLDPKEPGIKIPFYECHSSCSQIRSRRGRSQ